MNIFHTTCIFGNEIPDHVECKCHWAITKKMSECRDISNTINIWFTMVYWMIIGVILHLFIICYDCWCHFPFLKKTSRHNGSAAFGEVRCGCPVANTQALLSIKSFVQAQQVGHMTWDGVPMFTYLLSPKSKGILTFITCIFGPNREL